MRYAVFIEASQALNLSWWVDFGADCLWSDTVNGQQVAVGDPSAMDRLASPGHGWFVQVHDVSGTPLLTSGYSGDSELLALETWSHVLVAR